MAKRRAAVTAVLIFVLGAGAFALFGRAVWFPLLLRFTGVRTVSDVVEKYGPAARARLRPYFEKAGVRYPPRDIALLAFKKERRIALWARDTRGWRYIRSYPVLAASGHAGPKLREGDYQVPEGIYRIEHLNPNSSYHLSMKVSYPNAFDREMARRDGRSNLGGDIFIHGKRVSIGCLALGDPAIEELFTLVTETGHPRVTVVIAPNDLRLGGAVMHESAPRWTSRLYTSIASALVPFPAALESNAEVDVRGLRKVFPRFK